MLLTEFNEKEYLELVKKEEYESGKSEGIEIGKSEGKLQYAMKLISLGKLTREEAAESLGISTDELPKQ